MSHERGLQKPSQAFNIFAPVTREFLLAADREGTVDKYFEPSVQPKGSNTKARNWNMTVSYFATSRTHEEIGRIFAVNTRERVRQIINATLVQVWRLSSADLQQQFPIGQIPRNKVGVTNQRIASGLKRGDVIPKIADLSRRGLSYEMIKQTTGATDGVMSNAREKFNVPYSERFLNPIKIEQQMRDKSLTPQEVEKLWKNTSYGNVSRLRRKRLVLSVLELLNKAGLRISSSKYQEIMANLEEAEVKVGRFSVMGKTYYFIRSVDLETAVEVFSLTTI